LSFARKLRGDAQVGKPHRSVNAVHQDMARL
jgi:hypothetical protein